MPAAARSSQPMSIAIVMVLERGLEAAASRRARAANQRTSRWQYLEVCDPSNSPAATLLPSPKIRLHARLSGSKTGRKSYLACLRDCKMLRRSVITALSCLCVTASYSDDCHLLIPSLSIAMPFDRVFGQCLTSAIAQS